MIRRLVEQQGGGLPRDVTVREQDAGQLDAAALAARQGAQRLPEHPVRQTEIGADAPGFAFRGVTAEVIEAMFELSVAAYQGLVVGRLGQLHLDLGDFRDQLVKAPSGKHSIPSRDVQVAGTRVLGQVSDRPAPLDPSGVRHALSGQRAQGRRLTGAVSPDKADTVSGLDPQRGWLEQDPPARTQLQIGGDDHEYGS